ncbi:hypothetical protein ALC56_01481, partial [Trachymyrmex septentrionalis]
SHIFAIAVAKLHELRFELLPHTSYSSNLVPSNFFLFLNLKKWFAGKRYTSNTEVVAETSAYFEELEKLHYSKTIYDKLNKFLKSKVELAKTIPAALKYHVIISAKNQLILKQLSYNEKQNLFSKEKKK